MAEVLLIDDMAGVRRTVDAVLKRLRLHVIAAANGTEGLELLRQHRHDLVICDILMPQTDGAEVIFQLSNISNHPPVLAISGRGAGLSATEALQTARLRTDAFLEKPFDKDPFTGALEKLLAERA